MLDDDIVAATKRTIAATSNSGCYCKSKGKKGLDDQDMRGKCGSMDSRHTGHHDEAKGSGH